MFSDLRNPHKTAKKTTLSLDIGNDEQERPGQALGKMDADKPLLSLQKAFIDC